jgi:hypothetical protein
LWKEIKLNGRQKCGHTTAAKVDIQKGVAIIVVGGESFPPKILSSAYKIS